MKRSKKSGFISKLFYFLVLRSVRRVVVVNLAVLFLSIPSVVADDPPPWATNAHLERPFDQYFVGVGSAEFRKANEREEARKSAHDLALAALAREISVRVKADTRDYFRAQLQENKSEESGAYEETVETTTDLQIKDAAVVNDDVQSRRGKPDVYWIRVAVDRAERAGRLLEELKQCGQETSERLEAGRNALAGGRIATALRELLKAKLSRHNSMGTEALWRTFRPKGETAEIPALGPTIGEIDQALNNLFENLSLKKAGGDGQTLGADGALRDPLVTRLVFAADARPVGGLPVRFAFQNATGDIVVGVTVRGKGLNDTVTTPEKDSMVFDSDERGEVAAHVQGFRPTKEATLAVVRAQVALDMLVKEFDEAFRHQVSGWLENLRRKEAVFSFQAPIAYSEWIRALGREISGLAKAHDANALVFGAFWYGSEGPAVGPFGNALRDALVSELADAGISLSEWDAQPNIPALFGEYVVDQIQVELHWRLQAGDGTLWGEGLPRILREQLKGVIFEPRAEERRRAQEHLSQVWQSRKPPPAGALSVEVWTNHGPRPVFRSGDVLQVFVRANKDCYVQLIWTNSEGVSYFILPNKTTGREGGVRLTGGQTRMVPDPTKGETWSYRITDKTLGMETLKVLASTEPLTPPLPERDYPDYAGGFKIAQLPLDKQVALSKGGFGSREVEVQSQPGALAKAEMAEAICIIHQER